MLVFLSGGMRGNWQDLVMNACPQHKYIDPRTSGLLNENEYATWDLAGVSICDVVFANMECNNPYGQGLCVELGYAAALRKRIIFIDALDAENKLKRYFGMCRAVSGIVCATLEDGITQLRAIP